MPVYQRLCWIEEQIIAGRSFHMSFGSAQKRDTVKYKIQIGAYNATSKYHVQAALGCVESMRELFERSIVVDRGHQYSNGRSEVSFYVQARANNDLQQNQDACHDESYIMPPPAPPPIILEDKVEELSVSQLDVMKNKVDAMAEQVLANLSYSYCMYPLLAEVQSAVRSVMVPQNLIDAQNETIATLRAWADSESKIMTSMHTLMSSLAGQINQHIDSRLDNVSREVQESASVAARTSCVDFGLQWPEPRMKRYRFKRVLVFTEIAVQVAVTSTSTSVQSDTCKRDTATQAGNSLVCVGEASTQITARMLHDIMSDLSCEESADDVQPTVESADDVEESDEEVVSLPRNEVRDSPYYKMRVKHLTDGSVGRVRDVVRGARSGTLLYEVHYPGHETEHIDLNTLMAMRNYFQSG